MIVNVLTRAAATVAAGTLTWTAMTAFTSPHPAGAQASAVPLPSTRVPTAQDHAGRAFAAMPLAFEANRGQVDARVRYTASGNGFTLFLTRGGAVFDLQGPAGHRQKPHHSALRAAVAMDPVGADPAPQIVGRHRRVGTTSYFVGDRSNWRRTVPTFGSVRYRNLYPGTDMVFHGSRSGAEYDFVVAPGSDPTRIRYRLRGTDGLRLEHGDLVASTAAGAFVHRAPVAYQNVDGVRRTVTAAFHVDGGIVGFDIGSYDPSLPLVIDPETDVEYSTYLGSGGQELAHATALEDGDVYITGRTDSTDFPTTTGPYEAGSGFNAYVARISPDAAGAADVVSSVVLGGTADDENSAGIAVEGGHVYVAGVTRSSDFPTTSGAFDESFNGGFEDGFLVTLTLGSTGSADLEYSTFLGGSGFDGVRAIALSGGDAYLGAFSESPDYPTTPGAFDRTLAGTTDAILTRISPDGAGADDLVYSTYFGGSGIDSAWGIAVGRGDAYLIGSTWDVSNFPTTPGAFDRTLGGEEDAFLTRISLDGSRATDLVYSTYLGGPSYDDANGITVADGDAYVVGSTRSARFPTTRGAYDRTFNGDHDGYLLRISPDGERAADLRYATFFGAGKAEWVDDVVVDGRAVYVCGGTSSPAFPTTPGAYDRSFGGYVDATMARFSLRSRGRADLEYSTLFGGSDWDTAYELAWDGESAYVAGWTGSDDLPTTPGAFDRDGVNDEGFLVVIRPPDRRFRPDAWIRRDGGGNVGDDIYNLTGERQTRRTILRAGWRRIYLVTAQNDDADSDRLIITGPGSSADYRVRYYRSGNEITEQVTGRGYRTRRLDPGEGIEVEVVVKARLSAPVGSRKVVKVLLTSLGNRAYQDAVKAKLTVTGR